MTNSRLKAEALIDRYLSGNCSPEECNMVERIYNKTAIEILLSEKQIDFGRIGLESWRYIHSSINRKRVAIKKLWTRIAAAIALIIFGAGLFYFSNHDKNVTSSSEYANDIAPGKNGATLTLANGRKIILSDVANGELAKEPGISITKTEVGQVVYNVISTVRMDERSNNRSLPSHNILSTAKGETYMVILPDKSKVWLNADSKLTFSTDPSSALKRKVKLNGEAYFEVVNDAKYPFIVETNDQQVEVLGTHFNISNYSEDHATKTTLLEGTVRIAPVYSLSSPGMGQFVTLKPNQQSILANGAIKVNPVDVDLAVSWKNGEFMFRNESLESIMRKIARWYNIEVIYENKQITKQLFGGTISRFEKISEILKVLEVTGDIKFKIDGRKVIVMSVPDKS